MEELSLNDEHASLSIKQLQAEAAKYKKLAQKEFAEARDQGRPVDRQLLVSHVRQQKYFEQVLHAREELDERAEDAGPRIEAKGEMTEVLTGVFLSSYEALADEESLQRNGITHLLSACQHFHPSALQKQRYTCLAIDALDTPEQDILQHLGACITFITGARESGGKILVYCHAGQSRSVTIIAAYIMQSQGLKAEEALQMISEKHETDVSDNFKRQLRVFEQCGNRVDTEHEGYQSWQIQHRMGAHTAPSSTLPAQSGLHTAIRCKKCRFVLASEKHIQHHDQKEQNSGPCAHLFIDPVRWMKEELDLGELEGRFTCPGRHCQAKVGSYAWQGMNCSCRAWILPGLALHRSRVDEFKTAQDVKVEPARKAPVK